MTPQQALQNLEKAAEQFKGSRADHVVLIECGQVLQQALIELAGFKADKTES